MKTLRIKKLVDFGNYFDPKIFRHWRHFTYYRIFGNYFLIIADKGW